MFKQTLSATRNECSVISTQQMCMCVTRDSPDLELDALIGFTVPEWMLVKMRAHMQATSAVASLPLPASNKSSIPTLVSFSSPFVCMGVYLGTYPVSL